MQRVPGGTNDYVKAEDSTLLPRNEVDGSQLDDERNPERIRRFRKQGGVRSISKKPHVDNLLTSAYITAWEILSSLQEKAQRTGGNLEPEDLRAFVRVAGDVLPKLVREEREQQKAEGWDEMDVEELLRLGDESKKLLKGDTDDDE